MALLLASRTQNVTIDSCNIRNLEYIEHPTWFVLGQAQNLNDITVGLNSAGYVEVFALDPNPGVWHVWQTNADTGQWSDWQVMWGADL